jgi:hypothetical protein
MKKFLFSWLIPMIIVMPNLSFAQKKAIKGTTDTIAKFVTVKKGTDVTGILEQLQGDVQTVVGEVAYYTETKSGELIPYEGPDPEKHHAKLILMNWGDLPDKDDTVKVENRMRGYFDLNHPLVHPINGGKDGYQMEMVILREGGQDKGGEKPHYGFLDLKKTLANQLKDGTTYQVLVSISDSIGDKGKNVYKNKTAFYHSDWDKNASMGVTSKQPLIDYKKMVAVRIHWVKEKKGLLVDAKEGERGAKCVVSAWGKNTLFNPNGNVADEKPQYHLPVANNK